MTVYTLQETGCVIQVACRRIKLLDFYYGFFTVGKTTQFSGATSGHSGDLFLCLLGAIKISETAMLDN